MKMSEHTPAPTPSRSVYGFVLYLCCNSLFVLYLIWAYVPDDYLHMLGITYFPQKYWSYAIPIYLCVLLALFAFLIYPSVGMTMTPPLNDMRTVKDTFSLAPQESVVNDSIPPISDIPISEVCRHLYINTK